MRKIEVRAAIRALAEVKRGDLNPHAYGKSLGFLGTRPAKPPRTPRFVPGGDMGRLLGYYQTEPAPPSSRTYRPGPGAGMRSQ
jgi:hypothetical protein